MANLQNNDHNFFASQQKQFLHYLKSNVATVAMSSQATGIPEKNLCRAKRNLELNGKIRKVYRQPCKKTGFKAWYLTAVSHRANDHKAG